MTHRALLVFGLFALAACGPTTTSGDGCAETFPAFPDGGPAASGCYAGGIKQICEQSPSGTTCTDACSAGERPVTCVSEPAEGPVPSPDPAVGCEVLPIPTPMGTTFYCCPCGG